MPEYIDRKALGIGKCNPDIFENKSYANGWNAAIDLLEKAPTADVVEVRHGKWLNNYKGGTLVNEGFVSSCCDMWNERKSSFCPNCGAKME